MTEDEARELNRMSARIAALQLLTAWLLYKSLRDEDDPNALTAALRAKAKAAADSATDWSDDFRAAFVTAFDLVVEQSKKLLSGK